MFRVDYHKRVIKFLSKKDYKFRKQILDIFDEIAKNPYTLEYDIKPYKCSYTNSYRLRVGKYRYIYRIFDDEILIFVSDADSR